MGMVLTFTKKQQLIEALEAKRDEFAKIDKDRLKAHALAEKEYLAAFRSACREALKWDYETAKANYFNIVMDENHRGYSNRYGAPECPHSLVKRLDNVLAHLQHSSQERYTIEQRGRWSDIYDLLMVDQLADPEMC